MTGKINYSYKSVQHTYPPEWTQTPLEVIKEFSGTTPYNGTDKESGHSYGSVYDKLLTEIAGRNNTRILEIGVMSGGFTQVLHRLFPTAEIYAVDIDMSKYQYDRKNPKIHLYEMDGTLPSTATFLNESYDLIIEDGSHFPEHQKQTLDIFAPYLKKHGVYIIEDINQEYKYLKKDLQTIAFKHGLSMEWIDMTHNKGRFDDIVAIFRRTNV